MTSFCIAFYQSNLSTLGILKESAQWCGSLYSVFSILPFLHNKSILCLAEVTVWSTEWTITVAPRKQQDRRWPSGDGWARRYVRYRVCTVTSVADPGCLSRILIFTFLFSLRCPKFEHYFSFEVQKKKIWANFQIITGYWTFYSKNCH